MSKIKFKKAKKELLFFSLDGKKNYFYKEIEGYTFQSELKDNHKIELFVYKDDEVKNFWHVNDGKNIEGQLTNGHEFKTRVAAVNNVIDRLSRFDSTSYHNAVDKLKTRLQARLSEYTLKDKETVNK